MLLEQRLHRAADNHLGRRDPGRQPRNRSAAGYPARSSSQRLPGALARTDSHLWELTFGRTGFGNPDPEYGFGGPLDARKATLGQALEGMRGKTFRYLYAFGDAWEHSVKIQGIAPTEPKATILACSPPPACGRQRTQPDLGAMPRSGRLSPIRPMNTMRRRWIHPARAVA